MADLDPVKDKLAEDQQFEVPNTILAGWFGNLGVIGKTYAHWGRDKDDLAKLGFGVATFDNDVYFGSEEALARGNYLNGVEALSTHKMLHGIYVVGHGTTTWFGAKGWANWTLCGPPTVIYYSEVNSRLAYRLGAAIFHACESDNPNALALVSNNNSVFVGHSGVFVPVPGLTYGRAASYWGVVTETKWQVEAKTYGGAQATNTFMEMEGIPMY